MASFLTPDQIDHYREHGYIVLRQVLTRDETESIGEAIQESVQRTDLETRKKVYPTPETTYHVDGRYIQEPGLRYIATHPMMVGGAETLLRTSAVLSASVAYLKTPGAKGTNPDYEGSHPSAHQDYKTYQQAGSSVNWLFAIAPMVDLVEEIGPLSVSPGSFKCTHKRRDGRVWRVERSRADDIAPLQDAQLRRGDILFMNMFTWHQAGPNRTDRDRYGIYYKYRAENAPAASGPELYSEEAHQSVTYDGRSMLPHFGDRLHSGRVLFEHDHRFLLQNSGEGWGFLGGEFTGNDSGSPLSKAAAPNDLSNCIGQLQDQCDRDAGLEIPWMSYLSDFGEPGSLCRVYAHQAKAVPEPRSSLQHRWCTANEVEQLGAQGELRDGFETQALEMWLDSGVDRGIGEAGRAAASKSRGKA